jgi:hypothetical protein
MTIAKRLCHWGAVIGLTLLLAACGGGGGGSDDNANTTDPVLQGPPTAAGTLQASTTEASGAASSAADTAARLIALRAGLDNSPFGGGGAGAQSVSSLRRFVATQAARERALAVETLTCAEFFEVTPCAGSIRVDTNLTAQTQVIPAGTYVDITFNAISFGTGASATQLGGTLRVDFLTAFDTNATSLSNVRFQLTLSNLRGSAAGVPFGPQTLIALYDFDARGQLVVTADGLSFSGLDAVTATDGNNYTLPDVTIRRARWNGGSGYVDLRYSGWNVVAGRPTVGSRVTATAGGNSIVLAVTASSAITVVYDADISIGGTVTSYTVTATYPAGGGAPTYVAVPG